MRKSSNWFFEGLVTGLIGYITVVILFGGMNALGGEGVFQTAATLGSALFFGARDAESVVPGPDPILAYNGVHLLASLIIGLGASWVVFQIERHHVLWFAAFFIFLAGFIYSVVLMGVLAVEMAGLMGWMPILVANLAAGCTAGGYLWSRHRKLPGGLAEEM